MAIKDITRILHINPMGRTLCEAIPLELEKSRMWNKIRLEVHHQIRPTSMPIGIFLERTIFKLKHGQRTRRY